MENPSPEVMCQFLIGTVLLVLIIDFYIRRIVCQFLIGTVLREVGQSKGKELLVSIPHRYGTTRNMNSYSFLKKVSIPHRYGTTTVFTLFYKVIISHSTHFTTNFSLKVGRVSVNYSLANFLPYI